MPATVNLRPQNVEQTPNVMAEQAKLFTPPNLGYYWSLLSDQYPDLVDDALKQVTQESGDALLHAFESALKGLHLATPPPAQRTVLYRRKPIALWVEQRAKFPWAFLHDWLDWERLEGRLIAMPPDVPADAVSPQLGAMP
jgi:hypothetical protein